MNGSFFQIPPIYLISCSFLNEWITDPEPKNNSALNEKVFNITQNYRPDLVMLGHNNILSTETIEKIKSKIPIKKKNKYN